MERTGMTTGSIMMVLAIVLGAMGAHALKAVLSIEELASYETAVKYQVYHALAFLILSNKKGFTKGVYAFMISGVILFSGSIYLLVLDRSMGMDFSSIGFTTPVGGVLLIIGWSLLVINILREKSTK
ncbi:DUF423 domain-containing protein [Phaeocystidibacter marisrubri]|uniref:DUF423 domain-containing protein n=1 Tax=Phaeocystidibacter marisrubri TaxID=1577780 RepID=A0A6L3ZJR6_9FLAO|nr:DUF423 domain-containing protein [Phaeocystidibacter marisrubri]KAB2817903.1 DUF423 domain-containing protein [Phaeocystidibacter marisrubri]